MQEKLEKILTFANLALGIMWLFKGEKVIQKQFESIVTRISTPLSFAQQNFSLASFLLTRKKGGETSILLTTALRTHSIYIYIFIHMYIYYFHDTKKVKFKFKDWNKTRNRAYSSDNIKMARLVFKNAQIYFGGKFGLVVLDILLPTCETET